MTKDDAKGLLDSFVNYLDTHTHTDISELKNNPVVSEFLISVGLVDLIEDDEPTCLYCGGKALRFTNNYRRCHCLECKKDFTL